MSSTYKVHFYTLSDIHPIELEAPAGANLRQFLISNGISPYTKWTRRANCGGRGICATCGVNIAERNEIKPAHWHDWAADRFGYPRLSCQITVDQDMQVYEVDKWFWGARQEI